MTGASRTIFFGSGSFAVPILEGLAVDPRVDLVAVVSAPDRPAGRAGTPTPTPVTARATELGLAVLQPDRLRDPDAVEAIRALAPDLAVLADYGQIVPPAILDLPPLGILNVHPSILPRHRGATPIQATIAAGDREAGVVVMRMDDGIDTGPIVALTTWPLNGTERASELEKTAAQRGAELLLASLDAWRSGAIQPRPQGPADGPVTRRQRRSDARLDPSRPAIELERLVRANDPWPGAYLDTDAGRLIVVEASVAPGRSGDTSGRLVEQEDRLALATADGRLVLDAVQLAGRRSVPGDAFLRGQRGLVGSLVGEQAVPGAIP